MIPASWAIRGGSLSLARPVVMGILNLTPDSFSDGGSLPDAASALSRARELVEQGAGMLDIGGESTRPGADPVSPAEEMDRVLPFFDAAGAGLGVPLSVDTRSASVARAALERGAHVVNDVSGLAHDGEMPRVVAESGAGLVLMHTRGTPSTMREHVAYDDLFAEVAGELAASVARAEAAGIDREAVVLDPGIGFAKDAGQSLALLGDLASIHALGFPVLVGPSRKSFLGTVLDEPPSGRLHGTVAACVAAYLQGARVFRVHDVKPVVQALRVVEAIADAAAHAAKKQGT